MQYMGSKGRLAKTIIPAILQNVSSTSCWVEPFVGGCGMIANVSGPRIGNDSDKYVISLWKSIQDGWTPPDRISEDLYNEIKNNKDSYPSNLVAFVGYGCSFGGKFFGGYARGGDKNYAAIARRSLISMRSKIAGVRFMHGDYSGIDIPSGSVVYCDPPYSGTEGYGEKFDSQKFADWCIGVALSGNHVFVSEYCMDERFLEVLSIKHGTALDLNKRKKRVEKLYMVRK